MLFINKIQEFRFKFGLRYALSSCTDALLAAYKGKRKCIVCLAADYGNLGDVAITYAQTAFLKKAFSGFEVVDFPISKTLSSLKALKQICSPDDVITIVGGGNMGDMYFDIELLRLMIVQKFPHNRIICFPQTIDYTDSKEGKTLLHLSRKIYEAHADLILCAREQVSYEKMKLYYPACKVLLTPDIVMSLDERKGEKAERHGIVFCLRSDKELGDASHVSSELKEMLQREDRKITDYDTHIGRGNLSLMERKQELDKIWAAFRQSKWVVTDRLHGMIFAYITGTPAIVFPNSNFKVRACFEWIKNCGYIFFYQGETALDLKLKMDNLIIKNRFEETHERILQVLNKIVS